MAPYSVTSSNEKLQEELYIHALCGNSLFFFPLYAAGQCLYSSLKIFKNSFLSSAIDGSRSTNAGLAVHSFMHIDSETRLKSKLCRLRRRMCSLCLVESPIFVRPRQNVVIEKVQFEHNLESSIIRCLTFSFGWEVVPAYIPRVPSCDTSLSSPALRQRRHVTLY